MAEKFEKEVVFSESTKPEGTEEKPEEPKEERLDIFGKLESRYQGAVEKAGADIEFATKKGKIIPKAAKEEGEKNFYSFIAELDSSINDLSGAIDDLTKERNALIQKRDELIEEKQSLLS